MAMPPPRPPLDDVPRPFWAPWFGQQPQAPHGAPPLSQPEPRPRRGGRRSSFGILDPKDLENFRRQQEKQGRGDDQQVEPKALDASIDEEEAAPTSREQLEVRIVQQLIRAYFDIVRRDFCDKVPKAIMATMVNRLKDNLHNELVTALYEDQTIDDLMREPEEVGQRRAAVRDRESTLQKALTILNDTRLFSLPSLTSPFQENFSREHQIGSMSDAENRRKDFVSARKQRASVRSPRPLLQKENF